MARLVSYLLTALVGGICGAQFAAPEAPPRAERVFQESHAVLPRTIAPARVPEESIPDAIPDRASLTRKPPKSAEQAAAEESSARAVADDGEQRDYLELVRRHAHWEYGANGKQVQITFDRFEGADARIAGRIGNRDLGRVRRTIALERLADGKIRIVDPGRGMREGLRLWSHLEVAESKLPAYLVPYRGFVPYGQEDDSQ